MTQPQSDRKGSGPGKRARLPGEPCAGPPGEEDGDQVEHAPGEGASAQAVAVQIARYSSQEILRHKDFGEMSWEEIQAAKRAIAKLD